MSADASSSDNINAPPHYKHGEIECIDAIRSALTADEFRGYCKGNVLKYVWREKLKGKDEDLSKAKVYLGYINAPTVASSSSIPDAGAAIAAAQLSRHYRAIEWELKKDG